MKKTDVEAYRNAIGNEFVDMPFAEHGIRESYRNGIFHYGQGPIPSLLVDDEKTDTYGRKTQLSAGDKIMTAKYFLKAFDGYAPDTGPASNDYGDMVRLSDINQIFNLASKSSILREIGYLYGLSDKVRYALYPDNNAYGYSKGEGEGFGYPQGAILYDQKSQAKYISMSDDNVTDFLGNEKLKSKWKKLSLRTWFGSRRDGLIKQNVTFQKKLSHNTLHMPRYVYWNPSGYYYPMTCNTETGVLQRRYDFCIERFPTPGAESNCYENFTTTTTLGTVNGRDFKVKSGLIRGGVYSDYPENQRITTGMLYYAVDEGREVTSGRVDINEDCILVDVTDIGSGMANFITPGSYTYQIKCGWSEFCIRPQSSGEESPVEYRLAGAWKFYYENVPVNGYERDGSSPSSNKSIDSNGYQKYGMPLILPKGKYEIVFRTHGSTCIEAPSEDPVAHFSLDLNLLPIRSIPNFCEADGRLLVSGWTHYSSEQTPNNINVAAGPYWSTRPWGQRLNPTPLRSLLP